MNELSPRDGKAGSLCLKPVRDIEGDFLVPRYQRGYRWGQHEVSQLVNDIRANLGRSYCLQPIVVKRRGCEWELVDGQQRLTTLYLLVRALGGKPGWTLRYETRPQSADFLASPDAERARYNIDFHHIWQAIEGIRVELQADNPQARSDMLKSLREHVRVIWYEAPEQVSSVDLFTRLNSGRIPLNDAELFKALLLSQTLSAKKGGPQDGENFHQLRANEVAVQWDTIERDLRRDEIWAFLAGNRKCATHISLLLEIVAGVSPSDAAGTFKIFDELSKMAGKEDALIVWREVMQLHERMLGWYADRRQYHHIGFLIAQAGADGRDKMLREIATEAAKCRHSEFGTWLRDEVRRKLNVARSELATLRYGDNHAQIRRLLLLMNAETTARNAEPTARYPFAAYHAANWELEHIHAQNAKALNTAKQWRDWINEHKQAISALPNGSKRDDLLEDIGQWLNADERGIALGGDFHALAQRILSFLAGKDTAQSEGDVHGLGNLALLSKSVNISLGNSAFEVKRQRIIASDRKGDFIPPCTRHVFLKYYSDADTLQPHFWSARDRDAYLKEIEVVLGSYLQDEAQR